MIPLVALVKGLAMGLMFLSFFAGILIELVLVLPIAIIFSSSLRPAHRALMGHWLWWMYIFRLLHARKLDAKALPEGPAVLVANHPGLFDVVALIRDIPRLSVLVKPSLATQLPLMTIFRRSGYVLAADGASVAASVAAFKRTVAALRRGDRLLIFPEGTRSPKGSLHPFHAGALRIAREAGVPIQPLLLRNTPPFLAHGDRWYYLPPPCSVLTVELLPARPAPEAGEEARAASALAEEMAAALAAESRASDAKVSYCSPGKPLD